MTRTRFAPSPTGDLHLGHAYAARVARERGDDCLLRFEDIDHTRVRPEFYDSIVEDMEWLGISFDGEVVRQLDRLELYANALEKLKALGVLYPCFCTRKDLQQIDAPQGSSALIYPGNCRKLDRPDLSQPHCWRLDAGTSSELTGPLSFSENGESFDVSPD